MLIFLGLAGSVTNLVIMTGPEFSGTTFYYLRALSATDILYLLLVTGYLAEITLFDGRDNFSAKYYLTHWDVNLCNTFITASGFIIVLLNIDRYRCIYKPTLPRDKNPGILVGLALILSFILLIPRFMEEKLVRQCVGISLNNSHELSGDYCHCDAGGDSDLVCKYEAVLTPNLLNTFPWVTYVVLTELLIKVVPAVLLLVLNFLMINR